MEVVTLSNLVSLASEISGVEFSAPDAKYSEEQFSQLVRDIFDKINLLQKWNRNGTKLLNTETCHLIFANKDLAVSMKFSINQSSTYMIMICGRGMCASLICQSFKT